MSKLYQIRHVTRYRYEDEISENVMEVRKCPMIRENQRCLSFNITVKPSANLFSFDEINGNKVHHFDIPQPHRQMAVTAESLVEVKPPEMGTANVSWDDLKPLADDVEFLDYLLPSRLVPFSDELREFNSKADKADTPLQFLQDVNHLIATEFDYEPQSTQVDSSIDRSLKSKKGVCQDFSHIMAGIARLNGIPSRYVSGYLFHREDGADRSSPDATHAWMEAYLPGLGWLGFDPTNDITACERHIVTCVGRDYKDVPPTRGVYRGHCASELSVAVQVHPADSPHLDDNFKRMNESQWDSGVWEAEQLQAAQAQQ